MHSDSSLNTIHRSSSFLAEHAPDYELLLGNLKKNEWLKSIKSSVTQQQQDEENELLKRLQDAKAKKFAIMARRNRLALEIDKKNELKNILIEKVNSLMREYNTLYEYSESLQMETTRVSSQLKKFMQINVINDAFFIWYNGPFATINDFRLGNLGVKPVVVEWTEINAALGQAVLAIYVIANKSGVKFTKYNLVPNGSFSKVHLLDDVRNTYSLFTDGSFSLFPKRNFNLALTGFLQCVEDIGDHIRHADPTLSLPFSINVYDAKVNDMSILLGTDDESWTRALKFLLANIKWIIAWKTKHI